MSRLKDHFERFRRGIIGHAHTITTPYGPKPLVYFDWTASGRLYQWIEDYMITTIYPMVANTHTEATSTGSATTHAYHKARETIKRHVGADKNDVLIADGSGMTGAIVRLQHMLGLKLPYWVAYVPRPIRALANSVLRILGLKPVVFVTHAEHHSNHTSWLETICDVVVVRPGLDGCFSLPQLWEALHLYRRRRWKIGAFTACSNVTGIECPVHEMAAMIHKFGGICIVDYAASAPYVDINMHPINPLQSFDAVVFSPHKFLGGPGSSGILVVSERLIRSRVPFKPGGGTVLWTNPWEGRAYLPNAEDREDGGTPPFLQLIRAAEAIKLKEEMGVANMAAREHELLEMLFAELDRVPGLRILANNVRERQGIVSFYINGLHYGLVVKLLNDRYGIQTRGGCSCAGTYGHMLLGVTREQSCQITDRIDAGDCSTKPGWVRVSLHPTTLEGEIEYLGVALREIIVNARLWALDYSYDARTNEYTHTIEVA